jgi:hypothetical protein
MPARDPLAILARLRRLETDQARRFLAERVGRSAAADEQAEAAVAAIAAEAATSQPDAFGAWLTRGLAARARAAHLAAIAEREAEAARAALADARAGELAVAQLVEARMRAAARAAARAEQAALDDRSATRADQTRMR